ncbi:bridging integrator 2a [Brachionichthys hirsutus]|uniref:bridging integrator 2a n=1 Tax=Brachionichthys hirsutus TaxID=412623 RepID=UPI0036044D4C
MAESTSPKNSSGDFAKKVQRQLSRGKEKVLQRLGKTTVSRDDQFEHCLQNFTDQQTDGNRIYKDLRGYVNAVRDMREASRRLSQSLFDAYETDWVGEEDMGAIVEGEDLLWNDFEVKILDQSIRTMECYVSQFPDVRDRISKRGRKLVDYDSSRHHLEALRAAKKRDDVKILKAEEEVHASKSIYESINGELKEELPALYDSRIGCYVSVFSAISNLRNIFHKEMITLSLDLQCVMKELQAQHPDKVFAIKGMQRYGSLNRRTLLSPKAWKASFSDFHRSYSPKPAQRYSFRSPDKPLHSTLSRESSATRISSQASIPEDLDAGSTQNESRDEIQSPPAGGDEEEGAAKTSGEDGNKVEEEKVINEEEPEAKPPAGSDDKGDNQGADQGADKGDGENPAPSDSSSELNNSCDSESLELQLSAADGVQLHIEESEDSMDEVTPPKPNGLENGGVSGASDLSGPLKDAPVGKQTTQDAKSTTV